MIRLLKYVYLAIAIWLYIILRFVEPWLWIWLNALLMLEIVAFVGFWISERKNKSD